MANSNPIVKCSVDQCTHWMSGDQCMAAKIGIYNDEETGQSETSSDTQCKSFHAGKGVGDYVGALHNANIGGSIKAAFADGTQITPAVECYVNNCKFWDQGNYCKAPSIEVNGMNVAKSSETDCNTFEEG
ncbi:MAG: hypothetical protein H6Q73_1930 [Firmicutes bacterium]|nr:hypothetical protein [Bacillota bacterium]